MTTSSVPPEIREQARHLALKYKVSAEAMLVLWVSCPPNKDLAGLAELVFGSRLFNGQEQPGMSNGT